MINTKWSFEQDNRSQLSVVLKPRVSVVVVSGAHLNCTMSTDLLMKTKHVRAGYRDSVTKIIARIDEILTSPPPDKVKLLPLKASLKEKLRTLTRYGEEIVGLIHADADALATNIDEANEYKANIFQAITKVSDILTSGPSPAATVPPPAGSASVATARPPDQWAKLLKLALPRFGGNVLKWPAFLYSFKSALHKSPCSLIGRE